MASKEPKFTFFPWKLLALVFPLIALAGTLWAAQEGRGEQEVIAIGLAVLGAGNGYLLAAAIGDFGRSLIALPAGAAAGFLAAAIVENPYARALAFVALSLTTIKVFYDSFPDAPITRLGCIGAALMGTAGLFFGVYAIAGLGVLLCYPLVMAVVAAVMPADSSPAGRFAAMSAGVIAALYGMVYGAMASYVLVVLHVFVQAKIGGIELAVALSVGVGSVLGNYVCIRMLFRAANRVGGDKISTPENAVEVAEYSAAEVPSQCATEQQLP